MTSPCQYSGGGRGKVGAYPFLSAFVGLPLLILSPVFFANEEESLGIPFVIPSDLLVIVSVNLMMVNAFKQA